MKAKINYKDDSTWIVKSVSMDFSIVESLLIPRALRSLLSDECVHPDDKALARKLLNDWKIFIDNFYTRNQEV